MRIRHELLLVAVAVGVLGGTRLLSAQEAPPAPAEAAPPAAAPAEAGKPTEEASATATATGTEAEAEADAAAKATAEADPAEEKPATPPPKTVGATPGRFEPTEKVRADFDVSFPIDI
jgi:hypothetical protein